MRNLVRDCKADEHIKKELELAHIPYVKTKRSTGEVPYTVIDKLGGWTFEREWYY